MNYLEAFCVGFGAPSFLFSKRKPYRDRAANAKMDELLRQHKQALREGRLLMYQID